MKNLLKKLQVMSNQEENGKGSTSSPTKSGSFEQKPLSAFSSFMHLVTNRKSQTFLSPSSSTNQKDRMEDGDSVCDTNSRDADADVEEEYQIQLALELSAREDPEAAQIEAIKQISLGTCAPDNSPAEVVAFRYWNYNSLSFGDKILDGFYDLYGISNETSSDRMPSLIDLQGTSMSENVTWEAVLVDRTGDRNLSKLEKTALDMAAESRSLSQSELAQKLALLVADYMGGPVVDPESMLRAWRSLSYSLKATLGSMVLPLGSLTIGLARHRALLFKVLADSLEIPCRLVKGQQYTSSDDVAINLIKTDDGREHIVDLMAAPGTLIPSDAAGSHIEYDDSPFSGSPLSRDTGSSRAASYNSRVGSSSDEHLEIGRLDKTSRKEAAERQAHYSNAGFGKAVGESTKSADEAKNNPKTDEFLTRDIPSKPNYNHGHARSPSWTEGVSSPAARRMKVKNVSQYMIDAAKENPQLAQKLHDVLLESGVVAPPNLFTEMHQELNAKDELRSPVEARDKDASKKQDIVAAPANFLPPLPHRAKANPPLHEPKNQKFVGVISGQSKAVPVAAAVAAAAVVASTMVVAAGKANADTNIELPVAAAATATAAAVVATRAAVRKQQNQGDGGAAESDGEHDTEVENKSDRSVGGESAKSDITLHDDVAECEILWDEIRLGERIGLGSYGEVYRGYWHGTDVAVKKFIDQDVAGDSLEEFLSEIRIMKRCRHPNVVLFMGAVTRPPNLSIVTEFLPRGSLYRLLHRPNNQLDERRRFKMALDAARGMNYLHTCNPVIVHRDLKSPNLLVDRNWVVKVCDFGLSKMKHSTYLSTRSTAGTAEWMAPEVLRNELSNEKSDVYSYGVILWELFTLQQPWGGMNAMQVVGAVGFQHRRLDVPDDIDPSISDLIRKCWLTDPNLRPSFAEIMAVLKPLQKPITGPQIPKPHS